MFTLSVPIRIYSEANIHQHWSKRYKRNKAQGRVLVACWQTSELQDTKPPITIRLTRIAPRSLDEDNLLFCLKGIRDIIASLILPNLAPGQADDGHGITFEYGQKKGKPKEYALLIEIMDPTNTK